MRNRWNRLQEAEYIIELCGAILTYVPVTVLRNGYTWIPSDILLDQLAEAKERIERYNNKIVTNGWDDANTPKNPKKRPGSVQTVHSAEGVEDGKI